MTLLNRSRTTRREREREIRLFTVQGAGQHRAGDRDTDGAARPRYRWRCPPAADAARYYAKQTGRNKTHAINASDRKQQITSAAPATE